MNYKFIKSLFIIFIFMNLLHFWASFGHPLLLTGLIWKKRYTIYKCQYNVQPTTTDVSSRPDTEWTLEMIYLTRHTRTFMHLASIYSGPAPIQPIPIYYLTCTNWTALRPVPWSASHYKLIYTDSLYHGSLCHGLNLFLQWLSPRICEGKKGPNNS